MINIILPRLKHKIGLGDIVKDAVASLGFEQTSDCGCAEAQRFLNTLQFGPPTSEWDGLVPPNKPNNWTIEQQEERAILFHNSPKRVIWEIKDNKYTQKHSFCCEELKRVAEAKFRELCQL